MVGLNFKMGQAANPLAVGMTELRLSGARFGLPASIDIQARSLPDVSIVAEYDLGCLEGVSGVACNDPIQ
jgi:hypothetical protein